MIVGLILIVIGVVFFAQALGYIQGETLDILWPLLLVVLGFSILSHKMLGGHEPKHWHEDVDWTGAPKKKNGKKK